MAKKGTATQLQQDIHTDEELETFLQKDGLLLLEIYTGWCGPCVSMLSSLKKIKLEKGGEDFILSTVRADDVKTFERLRNKSEPTWLLATQGMLINGMFGTNVPMLMKLLSDEIDAYHKMKAGELERTMYAPTEMVPCELERYNAKKEIEDRNARIDFELAAQRRIDYIQFVTDEISDRLVDMGVTVMMPHTVGKDIVKKLPELGDKFGLTIKDKRMVQMAVEDLEILNFECDNPLPKFVLDILFAREAYMIAWKNADSELEPVETMLQRLVSLLTLPQPIRGDQSDPPVKLPPILRTLRTTIGVSEYDVFKATAETPAEAQMRLELRELYDHRRAAGIVSEEDVVEVAGQPAAAGGEAVPEEAEEEVDAEDAVGEDETEGEDGGQGEEEMVPEEDEQAEKSDDVAAEAAEEVAPVSGEEMDVVEAEEGGEEAEEAEEEEEQVAVEILPVWTPQNKRAQAALVYLYFRTLTDHFLPPDPEPDPPHVAIVFDAIKRYDIMNQIDVAPQDILAYGYFTAEQPTDAKLLATSTYKYEKIKKKAVGDRFVVKVSKKTSNTLLLLASQGPCYVSLNAVVGEQDCAQFFPKGYKTTSETGEDEEEEENEEIAETTDDELNARGDDEGEEEDGEGDGDVENEEEEEEEE